MAGMHGGHAVEIHHVSLTPPPLLHGGINVLAVDAGVGEHLDHLNLGRIPGFDAYRQPLVLHAFFELLGNNVAAEHGPGKQCIETSFHSGPRCSVGRAIAR